MPTRAWSKSGAWVCGLLSLAVVSGCQPERPVEWSTHFDAPSPITIQTGSGQAFDEYAAAAIAAEEIAADRLTRVHWTPGMRRTLIIDLDAPMQRIYQAQTLPFEFRHQPDHAFADRPFVGGWRLLGQAMIWRYQEALREGRREEAINWARCVMQFAAHLHGGGVEEATLGITLQSDLRRAIAENLATFTSGELNRLAEGALTALRSSPGIDRILSHEEANWLASVQHVQDLARQGETAELMDRLGPGVRRGVEFLANLSPHEQSEYLRALARDAQTMRGNLIERSALPAGERAEWPRLQDEEPTRLRLRQHLMWNGREFEPLYDINTARMRMFIISLRLEAMIKDRVPIPRQLAAFDQDLRQDPFSGRDFIYRAEGSDYKVYSVGGNLRDDGGDTDDLALSPDLWWEIAALDRPT